MVSQDIWPPKDRHIGPFDTHYKSELYQKLISAKQAVFSLEEEKLQRSHTTEKYVKEIAKENHKLRDEIKSLKEEIQLLKQDRETMKIIINNLDKPWRTNLKTPFV